MPFLIALDIGTSSVKTILLDVERALVIGRVTEPLKVLYPRTGWAEQSPDEIWEAAVSSIIKLLGETRIDSREVKGISIDAQMLEVVPVSREGEALYNFLTWLDTRGAGEPRELFTGVVKISGYNLVKLIKYLRITGGAPSRTGKDSISKIVWFKKNMPELYEQHGCSSITTGTLL